MWKKAAAVQYDCRQNCFVGTVNDLGLGVGGGNKLTVQSGHLVVVVVEATVECAAVCQSQYEVSQC